MTTTPSELPNQIKRAEIKGVRESMLEEQDYMCPLCNTEIAVEDSALDHCHKQGNVRMVLHRWCNAVLGRVENWSGRVGKTDRITFLKNTVEYLESTHTDMIHPTHGKPKRRRRKTTKSTKRSVRKKSSRSTTPRSKSATRNT